MTFMVRNCAALLGRNWAAASSSSTEHALPCGESVFHVTVCLNGSSSGAAKWSTCSELRGVRKLESQTATA